MVPGQNTEVSVKPARTRFFRLGTRFMHQTNPLQCGFNIIGKIGVWQGCAFGDAGGAARVNDQRQILCRVNLNIRWYRFGGCDHIIKEEMVGPVIASFGNFT